VAAEYAVLYRPGQDIELAQYGTSNIGRLKTLYREGLKNRYGALMQTISGVHYNFSLPMAFWQAKCGVTMRKAVKRRFPRAISAQFVTITALAG
jgi:glutamate--cysteine ligase